MFKGKTNSSDTSPKAGRRAPGRFRNHKRLTAVGVVAVLAVAGGAYAFWTGSGTGGGTATVGTSGTVTVAATVTAGIAPGTSEPVSFTAANPGTSPITVSGVHLANVTVDASHSTCVTADFTMASVVEAPVGFGHPVPAGATVEPLPTNGSLVYANTGVNQDACKGATLTLALTTS
jgi:hypothetical protein